MFALLEARERWWNLDHLLFGSSDARTTLKLSTHLSITEYKARGCDCMWLLYFYETLWKSHYSLFIIIFIIVGLNVLIYIMFHVIVLIVIMSVVSVVIVIDVDVNVVVIVIEVVFIVLQHRMQTHLTT